MNLREYVLAFCAINGIAIDPLYKSLGTQKRFSRLLNNPARATLTDVLRVARHISIHPIQLIEDWDMGKLMITTEDKAQLRAHYVIKPHNTLRDVKNHIQSPAPTQDPGANQQSLCVS